MGGGTEKVPDYHGRDFHGTVFICYFYGLAIPVIPRLDWLDCVAMRR